MTGARKSAFYAGTAAPAAPRAAAARARLVAPVVVARAAKGATGAKQQQITVDVDKPLGLVGG